MNSRRELFPFYSHNSVNEVYILDLTSDFSNHKTFIGLKQFLVQKLGWKEVMLNKINIFPKNVLCFNFCSWKRK